MATRNRSNGSAAGTVASARRRIIPFENGDRLPRGEFERRYLARPDVKKAELIEGVVLMPSPVSATHGGKHGLLLSWLQVYCASTPGVSVLDNATVRLDLDNEPQPDALLRIKSETIGRSRIDADDYVAGPPELVAEVAASSAAYDLHDKLRAYRRNGVLEYLVWKVYERDFDWFVLTDGEYLPLAPDAAGVLHSRTFPGLRLARRALLDGDFAAVLAEQGKGLDTPEHTAFTAKLKADVPR